MGFCDISFKRKNNIIEVKNNRGEQSPLYSKLVEYVEQNDVYTGREWFFDKLIEQGKLKSYTKKKEGVDFVFKFNPELTSIGSPEQYSQYLSTIFPNSKVKDILYHGTTDNRFLKYSSEQGEYTIVIDKLNPLSHVGTLTSAKDRIETVRFNADSLETERANDLIIPLIINSNPLQVKDQGDSNINWKNQIDNAKKQGYDSLSYLNIKEDKGSTSYLLSESEQIYILGSKQDAEGFKNYVQANKLNIPNNELALGLYSIAFNSGKTESYWLSKIDQLLPTKSNVVDYKIKAIEILQSDKAYQMFEKGKKNNWSLDKILSELMIPKDQKELIKEVQSEMPYYDEIPFNEQLAIEVAGKYSFGVEINVTKQKTPKGYSVEEYNRKILEATSFDDLDDIPTPTESLPTQHYSHLTVPGGTNYTENEISTPLITPSIKGHAQFATDKGIGWFRSDEQKGKFLKKETIEYEEDPFGVPTIVGGEKEGSTTRRILEVQSDLFQKGRDKKVLVNSKDVPEIYSEELEDIGTPFQLEKKQNSFLQLLNKDNNWVTFFIKSIIQDSFKKGYEKVLFPSGNTASKIEGHSTLEDFKKQKEDRLKHLESRLSVFESSRNKFLNEDKYSENISGVFISKNNETNLLIFDGTRIFNEQEFKNKINTFFNEHRKDSDNEINQLKQELERVEGPQGFGALKPIYNFYENTVTNILNKTYGKDNVKIITDEYGNTWNELKINEIEIGLLRNTEIPITDIEESNEDVSLEELIEYERLKIFDKYGVKYGKQTSEINRYADWGKLTSDIAAVNKKYGKVLELYQAPTGKWYLRPYFKQVTQQDVRDNTLIATSNSNEMNQPLSELDNEITNNWSNYFQGYDDLSLEEREQFAKLVESGLLEIQCKI